MIQVTQQRHAALSLLVQAVAARAGVSPPRSIGLVGRAEVGLIRGHLEVGLPLAIGLSAKELGVVIAHELGLPQANRRQTARLLRLRAEAIEQTADRGEEGKPPRRADTRLIAATASLFSMAEPHRDRAAARQAGEREAAEALLSAVAVARSFDAFVALETAQAYFLRGIAMSDVHDGWRYQMINDSNGLHTWMPAEFAYLTALHPGLARELDLLTRDERERTCRPHPASISLDELTVAQQRRLARDAIGIEPYRIVRWRTFRESQAAA